jgi:hypothetical protein
VSEVRKVKNVRPLTCEQLVELRLQSGTNHMLALARKYMNRRGKNMQTRSHELVCIFGGGDEWARSGAHDLELDSV